MKKTNLVSIVLMLFCLSLLMVPISSSAALSRQLQLGSRGIDVSDLQSFLAADSAIYPEGLVTGYFGSLTKAAVIRFQAQNGISQIGQVGPQTRALINAQMGRGGVTMERAPGFLSPVGVNVSNRVASFTINTDVLTRASVYYSTSPIVASENFNVNPITVTVSGTGVMANNSLQTGHTIASLPLESNRTYYFMAVVKDANDVVSVTYPSSFQSGL